MSAIVEKMYNPWDAQISRYIALYQHSFSRFRGIETNEALYDKAIADLSKKLDVYDKILAKQRYLAGNVSGRIHWV